MDETCHLGIAAMILMCFIGFSYLVFATRKDSSMRQSFVRLGVMPLRMVAPGDTATDSNVNSLGDS